MELVIGGKSFELKYDFESTEYKDFVDRMFKVVTMAYVASEKDDDTSQTLALINGSAKMMADLPETCRMAFYAGMLAKHGNLTESETYELLKIYMRENKLSWFTMFGILKQAMEDDGFFDLTGMTEFLENATETKQSKVVPMDHQKKKSSGGKTTTTKK